MRATHAAALFALSLAGAGCSSERKLSASHPCTRVGELRISGPHGERVVRGRDAELYGWFPERALDLGKNGTATLRCRVTRGKTEDCVVIDEQPDPILKLKFGPAALAAAQKFGAPRGSDGASVELHYRWTPLDRRCLSYTYVDYMVVTSKPAAQAEPAPR